MRVRSPGRTVRVELGSTGGLRTVRTMSSANSPRYSSPTPLRPSFSYVRARSGFLNTEPTTGSSPPGRNSFAEAGKSANRAWLEAVWERKVPSTTKPSRARRSAGFNSVRRDLEPQVSSARSQVAGVPGVPTPRPLVTPSSNGMGLPFSRKRAASALRGAVSRPSIVCTVRFLAS
ncbi:hypothetical protein SMICM17S_10350 [Streptomyces microflavus]